MVNSYLWSFGGALLGSILTAVFAPLIINLTVDKLAKKLISGSSLKDSLLSYTYSYYNIPWLRLVEVIRRAETGHPLLKPCEHLETGNVLSQVYLNPAQISCPPVRDQYSVDTGVSIGTKSGKPLKLASPFIIAAPSTGLQISDTARQALIEAANMSGTALLTGEQLFSRNELQKIENPILTLDQPDSPMLTPAGIKLARMLEIKLGQGSVFPLNWEQTGFSPSSQQAYIPHFYHLAGGKKELFRLVHELKHLGGGIPIAVRLAGSARIEKDLDILAQAEVDAVILEGHESSSLLAPAVTAANFGLPLSYALARASRFLHRQSLDKRIDLIASGGIWDAGASLKLLALGAQAVMLDNVVLFAMLHRQITKAIPWQPVESLVLADGKKAAKLKAKAASQSLGNFMEALRQETALAVAALGKQRICELNWEDLMTSDNGLLQITGITPLWQGV
ncbi:glutamate synthase-related protein [Syntrophomonas curvata]